MKISQVISREKNLRRCLANFDLKSIIFHEKNQNFLDFFYKFSMDLYLQEIPSAALETRNAENAVPKTSIFALITFFWKAFQLFS